MNNENTSPTELMSREIQSEILIISKDGLTGSIVPLFRSESGNCGTLFASSRAYRVMWIHPLGEFSQGGNPLTRIAEGLSVSGLCADISSEAAIQGTHLIAPNAYGESQSFTECFAVVTINVESVLHLPRFALSVLALGVRGARKKSVRSSLVGDVLKAAASMPLLNGYVIGVTSNAFRGAMTVLSKLPDGNFAVKLTGCFHASHSVPFMLTSEWFEEVSGTEMHAARSIGEVTYMTTELRECEQLESSREREAK